MNLVTRSIGLVLAIAVGIRIADLLISPVIPLLCVLLIVGALLAWAVRGFHGRH
jgi:uncharacterized membrane protein YccC